MAKKESVQTSRLSKTSINKNAKTKMPKASKENKVIEKYKCTCCGAEFKTQPTNFCKTMSPLLQSNNFYTHVCKKCVIKYFENMLELFDGNEAKAIDRCCQVFDIYYNDDMLESALKTKDRMPLITGYISIIGMIQNSSKGETYDDTIKDRASEVIETYEDLDDMKDSTVSENDIDTFGLGYEPSEYEFMNSHYKMLTEKLDSNDVVQEELIKDLCRTKVMQSRAIKTNNVDSFEKFSKLYQSTLKSANLKVEKDVGDVLNDSEACWGNFIKEIENYTPAEIYRDKKLFSDADEIKEYFQRFIVRPFKNFFTGSSEMDYEFVVHGDDDV